MCKLREVIDVRPAAPSDVPSMHRLRLSVRENALAHPARVTEASYLPHIEREEAWVAQSDGILAGFAILDGASTSVWALFVDPAMEGRGVGRALHSALLDGARSRDIAELRLTTSPGTRAEIFYIRQGWTRSGITADGEIRLSRVLTP